MQFARYVALGDSMSSDHYPTCDVRGLDMPPPRLDPLGAAALLYRNDDVRWPDFTGRDLAHRCPGVVFTDRTEDGALIEDVRSGQLDRLGHDLHDHGILVTLTAGGNDLLDALFAGRPLERVVPGIERDYTELVNLLRGEMPRATLVLTTVYDPTDGTRVLPRLEELGRLPLEYLARFNGHVRETAARTPGALVGDVHRHFLGHGITAAGLECWYWSPSPIEPSARGASEIRRVWWEALEERDVR
jgi:lysophospholipase L1-like esterase